ncbi:MAG: hypothetical protein ACREL5_05695 [Gemmatimonadales bacterium]
MAALTMKSGLLASAAILGLALSPGCASDDGPARVLRGVLMQHEVTRADSVQLAGYGQVIAMMKVDSSFLLLTSAEERELQQVPGVRDVSVSLGTDPTATVEVRLGVTPASGAVADSIASLVGSVERPPALATEVYARIPMSRLRELNGFPEISDLFILYGGQYSAAN